MKILLISGHGGSNGSYDPGACSSYGIEANETRRVVSALKSQFGNYNVNVDIYPTDRNAYEDVKNGCVQVNFANYNYVLEIHFNSSANSSANGVEIFVTNAENGTTVEQLIVNKIASLGYQNRGVKREDFAVIRSAKNKGVSSALLEVCFISNQGDMSIYNKNFDNICNAIVDGVGEGFRLSKNETSSTPTTNVNTPISTGEVCRILVNGISKIALTGLQKCIDYVKANYSKDEVKIQRVGDNAILWTQDKYIAPIVNNSTDEVKRYTETGIFYPNTTINFRNAPFVDSSNLVQGQYYNGESVRYDIVVIGNRYNWISWVGASGNRRYMPIKDKQTGESWGYAK